jgi:hypothetical protein
MRRLKVSPFYCDRSHATSQGRRWVPHGESPHDETGGRVSGKDRHAPAWYQEQAAHYRARAAQETALAALEYEVAQKAWLAQFSPEQQADIREMHANSLKHTIAVLERQIAELHAELQFWQPS